MNPLRTRAPGKIMLFGEYSVLKGKRALVVAVEPSATCTWQPGGDPKVCSTYGTHDPAASTARPLPFVQALFDRITAPENGTFTLEADAFGAQTSQGWQKFGLGSSAATTVALCTAVFASRGQSVAPETLFQAAHAAHRAVQGGGSGADIAASAYGGALSYQLTDQGPITRRLEAAGRSVLVAWTGKSADTTTLIHAFDALAARQPHRVAALVARLSDATEAGITAWETMDPEGLADAACSSKLALERLGDAMGKSLILRAHRTLAALARPFAAEIKSTGAGAGDLAWIIERAPEQRPMLRVSIEAAGYLTFEYPLSTVGARLL